MFEDAINNRRTGKKEGIVSSFGLVIRITILILALIVSSVAITSYETRTVEPQAEWEVLVHPYDLSVDWWDDIAFYNATEGWVIGQGDVGIDFEDKYNGIVMHTSNGGKDWDLVFADKDVFMFHSKIEIVDANTVWIATDEGLLHTENRGEDWEFVPGTASNNFATVTFRDSSYGMASISRELLYTDNGGISWNDLETWSFEETLFEINFVGDDVIWACGYTGIYRSSDGGTTWERQRNRSTNAMSMIDESEAWALGWGLGVSHCIDGVTWSEDMTVSGWRDTYDHYRDMEFIDENNGWLVGNGLNTLAYTPDGGVNWYSQSLSGDMTSIDFINETHGWAAGWNGVIARTKTGNLFGSKLIVDGDEIPGLGMGVSHPRLPKSASLVNMILLIALPVVYIVERVVFVIRRNRNKRDDIVYGNSNTFFGQ